MIDILKAKEEFKEYLKYYDLNDNNIKLKIKHTYEVVDKSEYLATNLGLDEENINLAMLIALLHDIGRFVQVKQENSFIDGDQSDHANYGVKILFEDNLIESFVNDRKYDNIIKKSNI